jgi:DNA gyrase/topoisomerase IV subunit B
MRFRPDPTIFACTVVDAERLRKRLHDIARLHPHLRVWFQEQRLDGRGGITAWARELAGTRGEVVESWVSAQTNGDVHAQIAFAWNSSGAPFVRSFVNASATRRGGSHQQGMWSGFCEYARGTSSPARGNAHVREAIGCGLVAVIHVTMPEPCFALQTRDELRCEEAAEVVRAAVLATLHKDRHGRKRSFIDERLHVDRARAR